MLNLSLNEMGVIYFFILKTLVTSVIFGGLPVVVVALIYFEIATGRRPPQSAFSCFAPSERDSFESIQSRQNQLVEQKKQVLRNAKSFGFLPKINGEYRFDGRNPEARKTNYKLDKLSREYSSANHEYRDLKTKVYYEKYWPLCEQFERYRIRVSWRTALRAALAIFLVSGLLVTFAAPTWSQQHSIKLRDLLWSLPPIPLTIYAPMIVGFSFSIATATVFGLAKYLATESKPRDSKEFQREWTNSQTMNDEEFEGLGWDELNGTVSDEDDFSDEEIDEELKPFFYSPNSVEGPEKWHEVLEVAASAGPIEIKTAHRKLMKQYHPDLLANMGPKLKKLAEEESRKINAAYEEGMHLNGDLD